jgi:aryl-alcohol dehydrogenase-like predicted oxidoreductase
VRAAPSARNDIARQRWDQQRRWLSGFGTLRLTGKGIWGPPADHDESIRVLRCAVELGVTFIDTADSYGPYVAEHLIHEALHPYPQDVVIATKGRSLADWS